MNDFVTTRPFILEKKRKRKSCATRENSDLLLVKKTRRFAMKPLEQKISASLREIYRFEQGFWYPRVNLSYFSLKCSNLFIVLI